MQIKTNKRYVLLVRLKRINSKSTWHAEISDLKPTIRSATPPLNITGKATAISNINDQCKCKTTTTITYFTSCICRLITKWFIIEITLTIRKKTIEPLKYINYQSMNYCYLLNRFISCIYNRYFIHIITSVINSNNTHSECINIVPATSSLSRLWHLKWQRRLRRAKHSSFIQKTVHKLHSLSFSCSRPFNSPQQTITFKILVSNDMNNKLLNSFDTLHYTTSPISCCQGFVWNSSCPRNP